MTEEVPKPEGVLVLGLKIIRENYKYNVFRRKFSNISKQKPQNFHQKCSNEIHIPKIFPTFVRYSQPN